MKKEQKREDKKQKKSKKKKREQKKKTEIRPDGRWMSARVWIYASCSGVDSEAAGERGSKMRGLVNIVKTGRFRWLET